MQNPTYKKGFFTLAGSSGGGSGDLLADGTVALTANWDVGAYAITALRFISDQATGTAPFTVASTTVVANLNASLLEGNAAAAFEAAGAVSTHAAVITGVHGLAISAGQTLTVTSGGTLGTAAYTASTAYVPAYAGLAIGDILCATSATAVGSLAAVAAGQVLTSAGTTTKPAWSASPTVTSLVLTGTGTLASTLGNATFTTSLTAASGNEIAFALNYTTNKAAGNDTGLVVNQTDTASPGTSLLADFQVAGVSKFNINNLGVIGIGGSTSENIYQNGANVFRINAGTTYQIYTAADLASGNKFNFDDGSRALTASSGSQAYFAFSLKVNQSGTAAATDLLINRTETAVGSGTQRLISAQVGSVERFGISNKGFETRTFTKVLTDASATDVFAIAVTAGSTAGGVITYTIDVTDDDASDDQIEVGTVQFCGLQDEANWHTNISEVSTQAVESGTLATTWAIDTATANTMKITCLADSDLTTPVITLRYTVTFNNAYTVTTY